MSTKDIVTTTTDPLVLSVQHFCLQDGPGIRSVIFFKGCPLRCAWCHNPESWSPKSELGFKKALCIGCQICQHTCPREAIVSPGLRDDAKCQNCYQCSLSCPSAALERFGQPMSINELINELRPEFPYYLNSGGGVTLSGGEATLFPSFSAALARLLSNEGIHVALETCGLFKFPGVSVINELLQSLDLVLFDIKLFNASEHMQYCGAGNELIKQNLITLASMGSNGEGLKIWPRLPLIPGITNTTCNLQEWGRLLKTIGLTRMTVVPYHRMGDSKREWLALEQAYSIPGEMDDGAIELARSILADQGIESWLPGEEVWDLSAG